MTVDKGWSVFSLTAGGDAAEVLLQLGHVERRLQGLGVDLVAGERSRREVGVGGVQAGGGDAAGYLEEQQGEVEFELLS